MKRVFQFVHRTQFGRSYEKSHLFFGTQKAAEARLARLTEECKQAAVEDHQRSLEWGLKYIANYKDLLAFFQTFTSEQQKLFDVVNISAESIAEHIPYAEENYEEDKARGPIVSDTWEMVLVEDELVTE